MLDLIAVMQSAIHYRRRQLEGDGSGDVAGAGPTKVERYAEAVKGFVPTDYIL
jgi:hypothetical protein